MKHRHNTARNLKGLFCTLFLGLISAAFMTAAAQVTGTVTDTDGEPLTGATIIVQGTKLAAAADIDGNFSLDAKPGQVMKVTYVGKLPADVKVQSGKTHYNIVLDSDDKMLDEVVVVGYGTMEKKRVTSAITSISADDMMSGLGGATIATALQGKISGLTTTGSASPNASNAWLQSTPARARW